MKQSIAILEDNSDWNELICLALKGSVFEILANFKTAESALEWLKNGFKPDYFLVDIQLPGMDGLSFIEQSLMLHPSIQPILFTLHDNTDLVFKAVQLGIVGYILKDNDLASIRNNLELIANGGSFLSGSIARKILTFNKYQNLSANKPKESPINHFNLTIREKEILEYLTKGYTSKKISECLKISIHTINNHLRHIYEKLQVKSRAEAVAQARDIELDTLL